MTRLLPLAGLLLASLLLVPPAHGQFVVSRSTPEHGAAGVSLRDTVAFAFSEAVSLETDWNTAFIYQPWQALSFSEVAVCLQLAGRCDEGTTPRFVRFAVSHEADTDYTWIVYAVQSDAGEAMARPLVLRYTTAPEIGAYTVSGSVSAPASKRPRVLSAAARATLHALLRNLEDQGYGAPLYNPRPGPEGPRELAAASFSTDPHTLVLLLDEFNVSERAWSVEGGTAIGGTSGAYTVDFVRPGTYWPVAVQYTDGSLEQIEAFGFHDADGDALPDSVVVEASSRTGIDLALVPFELTTARAYLGAAEAATEPFAADQQLAIVSAHSGLRTSGYAYEWAYGYYSPALDTDTYVVASPLGMTVTHGASSGLLRDMAPMDPAALVDSDAAMVQVASAGGAAFWDGVPLRRLLPSLQAGNLYWRPEVTGAEHIWYARVTKTTQTPYLTFDGTVDALDPGLVSVEEGPEEPSSAVLAGVGSYPNPATDQVTFSFELPRAAPVTLVVYDLLGREVRTVLQGGPLAAGPHAIGWDSAGLSSGVYLYRLAAPGHTHVGRLLIAR